MAKERNFGKRPNTVRIIEETRELRRVLTVLLELVVVEAFEVSFLSSSTAKTGKFSVLDAIAILLPLLII